MKIKFLPGNVRIIDGKAWIFWRGKRFRYKKGDPVPETGEGNSEKPSESNKT